MKKLTKKSLDELEKVMPVICESKQREFVGGGSGTNCDPYTYEEFESSCGSLCAGYVSCCGLRGFLLHHSEYSYGSGDPGISGDIWYCLQKE